MELLLRAKKMADYWAGTLHADKIESAVLLGDEQMLNEFVKEAEDACNEIENIVA